MNDPDVRPAGVSVSEAARALRVSPGTIRRRIAEGTLHAERVIRPQGTAWRVHLPDDVPATRNVLPTGTSSGASPSESDHVPVTYAPHVQDISATAGLVESIARLIAELAEVRVVSDGRADRVAELERENGGLNERVAGLERELAATRAPQSPLTASTEPIAPGPTMDAPMQHQIDPGALVPWLFTALALMTGGRAAVADMSQETLIVGTAFVAVAVVAYVAWKRIGRHG